MADAQIAIIDGDPTQIAVIDGDQTQIVMAPGENPAIVTAIPGPQGPAGAVAAAIDGSAALPSIAFASDTDTGLYRVGANQLGVSTGGTQRLVIDASGQIEATSLGSAASPTWTFVGDPDTGVFSPGANQIALSTNGTGRLFVDASGKIGVGTGSPSRNFVLTGSGVTYLKVTEASLGETATDGFDFMIDNGANAYLWNRENGSLQFATNNTERLRITSAGLVGIGTSAPSSILHCANPGTLQATIQNTAASLTTFLSGGSSAGGVGTSTNHPFDFFTNNQFRARIDSSGRVGIGTTTPSADAKLHVEGAIFTPTALYLGETTCGILPISTTGGSNGFRFFTQNGEKARLTTAGQLLVGTASNSGGALLQVNGDRIRVATAKTPASATDTGTAGEICWDANYIYVCTATNTWKRIAIATW